MDVISTSSVSNSFGTAGSSTSTGGISSDFNTFLRMLTVQMQNQDPLNPIDSADYAVQLATFSGVEQQVRTNQLAGRRWQRSFRCWAWRNWPAGSGKRRGPRHLSGYDGAP